MLLRIALLVALFTALAVPALAVEAPPDHSFKMSVADPGQTYSPNRENLAVMNAATTSNGLLLVFLSGTGAAPHMYNRLLRSAVEDGGYHSLGLDWVNGFDTDSTGTNIFGPCGDDGACFIAARQEAFDGKDATPKVTIGVTDSVLNRLIKALAYLDKTYPTEGWGAFLANGQPVWSKIVLAGHSNGSAEAGFIASKIAVARVAMFSGPSDSTGTKPGFTPASWMIGTIATPASLWYAFGSERDVAKKLDRIDRYRVNWPALGLGQPVRIDGMAAPFNNAHAMTTDLKPCSGCTAHNMPVSDKTPLDASGNAVYRPVWDYMLGSVMPTASAAADPPPAAAPAPATATAPAAADTDLPTPQLVHYDSNGVSLKAYLYLPPGTGPFPVYLWNHGSDQMPLLDKPVAKFWLGEGFAYFKPIRAGHGGNPGPYIVDAEKALRAKWKAKTLTTSALNAQTFALHEKANEDVVNAYKWLIAQPFADKRRIVVGGGSYGGIQTLMTAATDGTQKLGIGAFVAMSPAAESWRTAWGDELKTKIAAATAPIWLGQARNDYNLGPTETLGPLIDQRKSPSQCWLFPEEKGIPVKSDDPRVEGHVGFFNDPAAWGASVVAFLKAANVAPASTPDPAPPVTAPSHCSAKESSK
jgi:carboxymethylenebutenolidase